MAPKVLKIIVVADDETAGLIMDHSALSPKERDLRRTTAAFSFTDAGEEHELHFVLAEEV